MPGDRLALAVSARPEGVFIRSPEGEMTFREATRLVSARAKELADAGEVVTVTPRRDVASVVEILAAERAGKTVHLLDPDHPRPPDPPLTVPAGTHSVVYTSGAGARRKGVRLTAGNWTAAVEATVTHMELGPADAWLCVLPLHHVSGLSIIYRCLAAGATVLLEPRFDARVVARAMSEEATVASLVPAMVEQVLEAFPGPFPAVRWVLVGGGPIRPGLVARGEEAGLRLVPTYGMTETAAQVASARPADFRLRPLPGVEVRIGKDERIELRGPMVSPGYLEGPDRAPGEWFRTGDRGELGPLGELLVLGRDDRVIVSGGVNVDPEEVTAVLESLTGVEEAAVVGLPDRIWGEVVAVAYVGEPEPAEVEAELRSLLPSSEVPRRWLRVETLPRTELGKVDLAALAASFPPTPG